MIKRDELSNPNSCLNKTHDDEPIFVLRANDAVAAHVVEYWASAYVIEKQDHNTDGQLTAAQHAKVLEARGNALAMREWKRAHSMQQRRTTDATRPASPLPHDDTPVAWIRGRGEGFKCIYSRYKPDGDGWTPLYTRPR